MVCWNLHKDHFNIDQEVSYHNPILTHRVLNCSCDCSYSYFVITMIASIMDTTMWIVIAMAVILFFFLNHTKYSIIEMFWNLNDWIDIILISKISIICYRHLSMVGKVEKLNMVYPNIFNYEDNILILKI